MEKPIDLIMVEFFPLRYFLVDSDRQSSNYFLRFCPYSSYFLPVSIVSNSRLESISNVYAVYFNCPNAFVEGDNHFVFAVQIAQFAYYNCSSSTNWSLAFIVRDTLLDNINNFSITEGCRLVSV